MVAEVFRSTRGSPTPAGGAYDCVDVACGRRSGRLNEAAFRAHAERDLNELVTADTLVVLNLEKSEGKAVEFGVALDAFMRLVVIGQRSHVNIFHYLQTVEHFDTLDAFIESERQCELPATTQR